MKKRILEFLIKIGKKCKPLTYPVMIVVIAFLTIYHAIRNLFIKENKWKSLVTGAICLVAVVGAVLVLPSLADEMTGESQTETVSEEELEPTMTPDVTVEPVVTEEPEEKQDSEETESAEETTKPEEEKKDEEKATDEPQATEEPQYQSAAKQDESDNLPKEEKKAIKKKREAAPVQLEKPTCQVVEQPVGPYTYPMDSTIKVKVEVTPPAGAGYVAPTVDFTQTAKETKELTPKGGKADNYTFEYVSGLLLVDRRYASAGKDGQYRIEGSVSDTGWYTSDLRIVPKDGYELLREEEGKALDEIALTKDTDCGEEKFYIMNETTGEIYYPSVFNYKKDTKMPEIKGVEKDATYEANSREVTVSDENLSNVTVNGKPQSMENNTVTFTLTAEQETMVYVITATDCAGNMSDCTVVLNQPASLPASDDTDADNAGNSGDNNTDGNAVTPTASPSQAIAGIVKKHVKVVDGAPNTALVTGTQDLKTSVLSNGEQQAVEDGSNASIELRIKNIDGSVPQNDKELVIANLSGYSVGEYLDITLWKKVGSSSEKEVTNLAKPISVTVTVPSDLRNASREFVVLRVHKGKVSVLEDLDSATNTVTFKTDRFSTYALAYRTAAALTTRQTNSTKNTSVIGTLATNPSPATGDTAPLLPIAIVFLGSLSGILITMVLRRKM